MEFVLINGDKCGYKKQDLIYYQLNLINIHQY